MDAVEFFKQFQDHLAPKLDSYEQAIYTYVVRHSRLIGRDEAVIGFKSARRAMALGIGKSGTPMSEHICYERLRSLEKKGCLFILGSERAGTRVRVVLPCEMPGLIPQILAPPALSIDDLDFFNVPENRIRILDREGHRCFYCLRQITPENHVIEHVVSRPNGDDGYRNVVAACRQCNNRKGSFAAEDFLRTLYREALLTDTEFEDRISHLQRLRDGGLKPSAA